MFSPQTHSVAHPHARGLKIPCLGGKTTGKKVEKVERKTYQLMEIK